MRSNRFLTFAVLVAAASVLFPVHSSACTSVIVSGKYTASGKPLLLKVRDNDLKSSNTTFQFFEGEKYIFLGNVSDATKPHQRIRSTVGGYNSAGLCMASLTAHGFPLDTAKKKFSGGNVIYEALGSCANLREFEAYVERMLEEHIIITNIGAIDAEGGAAYYEFGGHTYTKFDVNDPESAPDGYRAITNFCFSGDTTKGGGLDRYDSAMDGLASLKKNRDGKYDIDHTDILDNVVRSFRHHRKGISGLDDLRGSEYYPFAGFITRYTTNCAYVFEGVKPGDDPKFTVLWANIGNPCCAPSIPLVLGEDNILPEYIWAGDRVSSAVCQRAAHIRAKYIFDRDKMMNVTNIKALVKAMFRIEKPVRKKFNSLHDAWAAGRISDEKFYSSYRDAGKGWWARYLKETQDWAE